MSGLPKSVEERLDEILWKYIGQSGSEYTLEDRKREVTEAKAAIRALLVKEVQAKAVKAIEAAQTKMRPMILIDEPLMANFAMYWDDKRQVWMKARYQDLIAEAKRQLTTQEQEQV